jgi:hypothetical protein
MTYKLGNLSAGGLFVAADTPRPRGTLFNFECRLGAGDHKLEGQAQVIWTRQTDQRRDRPPGMGARILSLTSRSQELMEPLLQVLAQRRGAGENLSTSAVRVAPSSIS